MQIGERKKILLRELERRRVGDKKVRSRQPRPNSQMERFPLFAVFFGTVRKDGFIMLAVQIPRPCIFWSTNMNIIQMVFLPLSIQPLCLSLFLTHCLDVMQMAPVEASVGWRRGEVRGDRGGWRRRRLCEHQVHLGKVVAQFWRKVGVGMVGRVVDRLRVAVGRRLEGLERFVQDYLIT